MILKRPYGLMIKHFKLIHVLLLLLSFFCLWQLRPLVSFFNEFVAAGYTTTVVSNMAGNYINSLIYLSLLLMLVLLVMLIVLLRFKKKPMKIYTLALIYYAILLIGILIASGLLNSLEDALWTTTQARMYRDIATMITIPQYIFLPFWLIRALGFNIKQFNFKGDLAELDLVQADSEEIEINIGFETYKARRTINRFIREFKYYFSENKFVMSIVITITSIILIYLFASSFKSYTTEYKMNQAFSFSNMNIVVNDSIITNLDYAGNKIDDSYYLLLKLTVTNNNELDMPLEYNKFIIYSKKNYYEPIVRMGTNFIDYAESYNGSSIKSGKTRTIVLPYKISNKELNDDFRLGIYTGINRGKKENNVKSISVKLTPVVIDNVATVLNAQLNETINLNNTYLNNTTLTINKMQMMDRYVYSYDVCYGSNNCNTFKDIVSSKYVGNQKQTLLILDYDLVLDTDTPYAKLSTDPNGFAQRFMSVSFTKDNKEYTAKITDVTPDRLKKQFVFQVTDEIKEAQKVNLVLTIRDKSYIINLISR